MFDPTPLLYVAIAALVAGIVVQGVNASRTRRDLEAKIAENKVEYKAATTKLAVAASKAILAIITSAGREMKRLQVKTIGATLAEVVKLEKATGERVADLDDDRFDEIVLGGRQPTFTRGEGFTMHGSDPYSDLARSAGVSRSAAKADVLGRGYGRDNTEDALRAAGFHPVPGSVREQTFAWSPGDPIPADAPAEIQDFLRSIDGGSNPEDALRSLGFTQLGGSHFGGRSLRDRGIPSIDDLLRSIKNGEATIVHGGDQVHGSLHDAGSETAGGVNGETKDGGSAEPLADPHTPHEGFEHYPEHRSPSGFGRRQSLHVESADRPERG